LSPRALSTGPPKCIVYFEKITIQFRDPAIKSRDECDLEGALTAR